VVPLPPLGAAHPEDPAAVSRAASGQYDRPGEPDATLAPLLAAIPPDTIVLVHGDHGERLVGSTLAYRWYRLRRDLLGAGRTQKLEGHETDVYEDLVRVALAIVAPAVCRRADASTSSCGRSTSRRRARPSPSSRSARARRGEPGAGAPRAAALDLEAFIEAFGRVRGTEHDRRLGWRTERWKYVEAPHAPDVPDELFDLVADPRERRNLAPSEPAATAALKARVAAVEASAIGEGAALSAEEEAAVEARLRDLGYIE
jgi:hypothetical protein